MKILKKNKFIYDMGNVITHEYIVAQNITHCKICLKMNYKNNKS